MLKTLIEVYRGSLSLQGVFKFRGQAEKVPHAVLVHWSGGAPLLSCFHLGFDVKTSAELSSLPRSRCGVSVE